MLAKDSFTGELTRTAGQNVGTYAIEQGTLDVGLGYILTYVSDDLTITQRDVDVTADYIYKAIGTGDPALTYSITSGSLAYSDVLTGSLTRDAGEALGDYAITQGTLSASSNYNMTFIPSTFSILNLLPQSITFNALATKTYGDADFNLAATSSSGLSVTYASSNTDVATVTGNTITIVGAGTADITASQAGNTTYETASNVVQTLTVNKLDIELTADAVSKTYGDADPAFTYTITSGSLVGSDTFTGALSRTSGEDVNDYAIQQGTLDNNNYNISLVSNNLTIAQRDIEVTANDKSKYALESDPVLDYTITRGSLAFSDAFSGAFTREAGEAVGTYAINQGTLTAGSNYNLTFIAVRFQFISFHKPSHLMPWPM